MLKQSIKIALITAAVSVTAFDKVFYIQRCDGKSMQPTINNTSDRRIQDLLFIMRPVNLKYLFGLDTIEDFVNRGDVVTIVSPKDANEILLKRVVGLPGDIVKTIGYKKKYVKVPEGHCWIEGDNYRVSRDSNSYGCLSMALIEGHAKYIMLPYNHMGPIKSTLPEHRRFKKLHKDSSNYFIDFKSEYDDDVDEDEDEQNDGQFEN